MLIWTGTATVTNGDATVVVDTGAAFTAEVVAHGAMVVLNGVVYFADSLTDTTSLEMTRDYVGSTGTADMEIWPVSQDTTNLVNLAQIVARTQAQINILDKNSQGLFFMMKGVTGAADPGPGFIAFDDADATLVTEAYIDALDANGRAVSELVGLWEAGTTIVVRSLSTTAYRAYAVATNTDESGWTTLALTYVGHDGVLADNEALAVSWSIAATGLDIDATGNFADRSTYDDEPAGFVFLSADGDGDELTISVLFRKNSATTADWGPAVPFQGPQGEAGWSPVFAVVSDGARRVLRLVDYVGGEGTKPTAGINQYVSSGGLTGTIGSATDIRGPIGLSAYEVAVAEGFVGDEAAWLASLNGADGTDPGALYNWDDGTTDADPGAGNMRADSVDLSDAEFLYVSKEGRTGDDLEAFLLSIGGSTNTIKGHVTLTSSGGNAQAIVAVESLTDATGYVKIGLVADSHSGATSFVDATAMSLQWNRAGDQGDGITSIIGGEGIAVDNSNPLQPIISLASAAYNPNTALMALEVADLKGARLFLAGGIADPFDDETGVDAAASSNEVYDSALDLYSPSGSGTQVNVGTFSANLSDGSAYTYIDRGTAVLNSVTVNAIGIYSNFAGTFYVKIARRDSAGNYTFMVSEAMSHTGGGLQFHALSSPYAVPGSGTFYLAAGMASGNVSKTAVKARAYKLGNSSTGAQTGFTEDSAATAVLSYIHSAAVANMVLGSIAYTADAEPTTARLAVQVIENEAITLNTDLTAEVSRDGGANYALGTLVYRTTNGGTKLYEAAEIDLSGQPSGTSMKWRVKTLNNKDIDIAGVVLQWL